MLAGFAWYAQDRFKPRCMVDLATLTGAIIIALGSYQTYYGLTDLLRTAIKPQYYDVVANYWETYTTDAKTCPAPAGLLVDGFFERYTAAANSGFLRQCAANRATYWSYDPMWRAFRYRRPAIARPSSPACTVRVTRSQDKATCLTGSARSSNLRSRRNVLPVR